MSKHYILEHFARGEGKKVLSRFNQIIEIIKQDEVAISLLEKLVESAERYFGAVVNMETRLKTARFRMEGDQLRDFIQTLDRNRHQAHEALISNLHIFNRYAIKEYGEKVPVGGLFSKPPEAIRDRIAVADWAGELLYMLYSERKR